MLPSSFTPLLPSVGCHAHFTPFKDTLANMTPKIYPKFHRLILVEQHLPFWSNFSPPQFTSREAHTIAIPLADNTTVPFSRPPQSQHFFLSNEQKNILAETNFFPPVTVHYRGSRHLRLRPCCPHADRRTSEHSFTHAHVCTASIHPHTYICGYN